MKEAVTDGLIWLTDKVLFWKESLAEKGRLLRVIHNAFLHFIVFMVILTHTLYPSYFLQTLILGVIGIVWLQHMVFHVCIVTDAERKMIGDEECVMGPIVEIFNIKPTPDVTRACMLVLSTTGFGVLSLEWLSRTLSKAFKVYTTTSGYLSNAQTWLTSFMNTIPQALATPVTSSAS